MSTDTKAVEDILASSHALLTVNDLRRATGLDEPTVRAQLKALAQQGQIEHIPGRGRYDGKYGLLRTTPQAAVKESLTVQAPATGGIGDGEADGELHAEIERLKDAIAAQADTVAAKVKVIDGLRAEIANAKALNDKLEHLLGSERTACAALREQLDHMTHSEERAGLDASLIDSFAVIAPKRPMRRFTAHDSAVKSAMAAASNGSKRGEVFALVHVGSAKRGAVWRPAK